MSPRELAQRYHEWGWAPIPLGVGKKKATEPWQRWQSEFPPPELIRKWWPERSKRNVGILCGEPSGGLLVRDFDAAGEYEI